MQFSFRLLPWAAALALAGCAESSAPEQPAAAPAPAAPPGQQLFGAHCARCHGADGRAGRNGAHDLTKSNLNAFGRTYLVTNGLGQMPAFKETLTAAEIEAVVTYSLTLR